MPIMPSALVSGRGSSPHPPYRRNKTKIPEKEHLLCAETMEAVQKAAEEIYDGVLRLLPKQPFEASPEDVDPKGDAEILDPGVSPH